MHKFFKVILNRKTDSLTIPPEFAKRCGHNLPNPVLLKVPNGSMMVVELVRSQSDGKTLMLQKGWKDFRERYAIGFGHFLVFEYNGKSEFNVTIFDKTAVEINYPIHADDKTGDGRKVKAENQENTAQAPQQIHSSCYQRDSKFKPDCCRVKLDHESAYEKCGDIGAGWQFSTRVEMQRSVMKKKTSIAYQKALAFASAHIIPKKNPFAVCLMHHSHVCYGFSLKVPFSFAEQNLPCTGGDNSANISIVMDAKRWSVRCIVRNKCAVLSGGWKRFVVDNGIKKDDVCLFEVAERTKPTRWNVVVFRSRLTLVG